MAKLELVKVETDTERIYKPMDNFNFKVTLDCHENIDDDVEFEVVYFGDAYTEKYDQRIGYNIIGPLQKGKQFFELETSAIDLTKIPIKTLFGLTTILIVGKYHGQQFIRIGYVADVSYPSIKNEKLMDSTDTAIGDLGDPEMEADEIEIMDDEELEYDSAAEDEDDTDLIDDTEGDEECEISGSDDEGQDIDVKDYKSLSDIAAEDGRPAEAETPIKSNADEFKYKGFSMKPKEIQIVLLQKPIIHVYDIEWKSKNSNEDEVVESSEENDKNGPELGSSSKKSKIE